MEPIQLQCGSCGQVMAISPEHLGSQVQCPHCQAIVQTPSPAANPVPAPPLVPAFASSPDPFAPAHDPFAPAMSAEPESIFSQQAPTDDLFGAAAAPPRLEYPPPFAKEEYLPPPAPTVTMEPAPLPAAEPMPLSAPAAFAEAANEPDQQLAGFTTMRRVDRKGSILPYVMIFLVPYAIFTTAFIGYLLMTWPRGGKLEFLPDPALKGQPRDKEQVKHDYELLNSQITRLNGPIRVGDIEVTPLKVQQTANHDLMLVFKAKNMSQRHTFAPTSDDYMRYSRKVLTSARPYTFLGLPGKKDSRVYGGNVEMFKGGSRQAFDGDIGPGQEAIVHLTSEQQDRNKVKTLLNASEPLVWRIQVRRGMVEAYGREVSTTTVIGIEFSTRDVGKG